MRAVILLCLIHLVFARRVPQSPLLPLQDERNVDTIPAADLLAGLQHQLADLYHALDNEIDYLPRLLTVFQYWMPLTVVGCESVPCENLTDPAGATVSFSQTYYRNGNVNATVHWVYANVGYVWSIERGGSTDWAYSEEFKAGKDGSFIEATPK